MKTTTPLAVKWILEKGYNSKELTKNNLTHVSLGKGSYSIPYSATQEFHRACAQSISRNDFLHFVEIKGDFFRFFLDIDYKSKLALESTEIQSLSQAIFQSISSYIFDKSLTKCIVCTTKPKEIPEGFKTGIHIIWPEVIVDSISASLLAKQLAIDLESAFGPRQNQGWTDLVKDAIDSSVYKHKKTGLRMKFCSKPEDTSRVYKPSLVFGDDKLRLEDWTIAEQLDLCSIRTDKTEKTRILREDIEQNLIHQEEEAQFISQTGFSELSSVDEIQVSTLEEYIRRNFPKHEVSKVRKVVKVDKTDKYIVFVDSKFCLNLGRCHKSNNVYFIATKEGVAQRCFCNCMTKVGRKSGYCKEFQSPWNPLQSSLLQVLFGGSKGKKRPANRRDDLASKDDQIDAFMNLLFTS